MHVQFSFHHVSRNPQLDKAITSHVKKLEHLLTRFSPDLIRLHGIVELSAVKQGPICTLNLWLPTARLHAREAGGTSLTDLQKCFDQLIEQVKKHKQFLRREGVWKRRRYKFKQEALELQAAEIHVNDRQQLREYLEQVLPQLVRFIARELRYREMAGILPPGQTQQEEIVDEVVARALEGAQRKPADSVPPFHLLISEAIEVLNGPLGRPASADSEAPDAVTSGEPADIGAGKIGAARLWRQAQGSASAADSPEHSPDPVDLFLASLPILHRQVYVLHALEGFTWDEAARALGKSPAEVEEIFRQVSPQVATTLHGSQAAGQSEPRA